MSESETTTDSYRDVTPDRVERLRRLWYDNWSSLAKALGVSAFVHVVVAIPFILTPTLPGDFDVDWQGEMGDLSGIGHGVDDFDEHREVDWDDMDVDDPPRDDDPDDEPEEATEDEEPPDPDDDTKDESREDDDTKDEPDEQVDDADEQTDEDDVDDADEQIDDEVIGQAVEEDDESHDDTDDAQEQQKEDVHEDDAEFADAETSDDETSLDEIPGIDRSSPSNLPDLRTYAPGNARITSLVRTDRLRDTELEPYVETLLRAVPDYRIALEGTRLDPVEELDSIFMATANPEHLHETFLAVRHSFETEAFQTMLDERFDESMEWETRPESDHPVRPLVPDDIDYFDPRRLLVSESGLAMMGRAVWFDDLIGPVDEDSELGQKLADRQEGPSSFELLDGLSQIEEAAEREDTLLLLSAYGFTLRDLPLVDDIPHFEAARLEIRDAEAPELIIDLRLRSEAEARQFKRDCPRIRRQLSNWLLLVGMSHLIEPLECKQQGEYVIIEGQYSQDDVKELLDRGVPMIEATEPRALEGLPEPPPEPKDEDEPRDGDSDDESADEADSDDGEDIPDLDDPL